MAHSNVCCIPMSSQEWAPQQIYPKLRPSMLWETAKNSRTPPQTLQVHSKHLRPTASMVVERWRFGHLTVTEQNMNCSVYQSVLESNVKPSVWQLKPEWNWVINRTIIPSTAAEKGKNQCCGPVKVQTSTRWKWGHDKTEPQKDIRSVWGQGQWEGTTFFTV